MPKASKNQGQVTIADQIRKVRKAMGWSQRDMANKLALSDKAVSSYEVGRSSPTIETVQLLSKLTKRPVSYFFDTAAQEGLDLAFKLDKIQEELTAIRRYLQTHKPSYRDKAIEEPSSNS